VRPSVATTYGGLRGAKKACVTHNDEAGRLIPDPLLSAYSN